MSMDDYGDGLRALIFILEQSEYSNWTDNIRRDLENWEKKGTSQTYLGNFGGMGSFNDFYPSFKNIPERKKSLYFQYFLDLQSYTYFLAKYVKVTEADMEKMFDISGLVLRSSYCKDCEARLVLKKDVWDFSSNVQGRKDLKNFTKDAKLLEMVRRHLNDDITRIEKVHEQILKVIEDNGIILMDDQEIKSCPKCNNTKIGILQLNLNQDKNKLVPYHLSAKDLPERVKAAFK